MWTILGNAGNGYKAAVWLTIPTFNIIVHVVISPACLVITVARRRKLVCERLKALYYFFLSRMNIWQANPTAKIMWSSHHDEGGRLRPPTLAVTEQLAASSWQLAAGSWQLAASSY